MASVEGARLLKPIEEEESISSEFGCFGCCFGYRSSGNWWHQGFSRSLRKAREWSGCAVDGAENSGQTLKNLVRRLKKRKNTNMDKYGADMKAGAFHYDPSSYALNFDDGSSEDQKALIRACR